MLDPPREHILARIVRDYRGTIIPTEVEGLVDRVKHRLGIVRVSLTAHWDAPLDPRSCSEDSARRKPICDVLVSGVSPRRALGR
jgi:hypothetical protein